MESLNKLVEKLNENEYVQKALKVAEEKTGRPANQIVGGKWSLRMRVFNKVACQFDVLYSTLFPKARGK